MTFDNEINVFIIYGKHNNYEFDKVVKIIETIISIQKLNLNETLSIIENSVNIYIPYEGQLISMNYDNFSEMPAERVIEEGLKLRDKFVNNFLENIFNKNNTIPEDSKPFHQKLMEYLQKKGIKFILENNNARIFKEYVKRYLELQEYLRRKIKKAHDNNAALIPENCLEIDFYNSQIDMRDQQLIEQMKKISAEKKETKFLIVRGCLHKRFSNFALESGFKIKEYYY